MIDEMIIGMDAVTARVEQGRVVEHVVDIAHKFFLWTADKKGIVEYSSEEAFAEAVRDATRAAIVFNGVAREVIRDVVKEAVAKQEAGEGHVIECCVD